MSDHDKASIPARQGDLLWKKVSAPDRSKPSFKRFDGVFAYGEVTGHSHRVISPSLQEMDSYIDEKGDIYVLSRNEDIKIGHDEHDTVTLPKGDWYCLTRQREYDPVAENRERQVAD